MKSSYSYTLSSGQFERAIALRGRRYRLPAWMRPTGFFVSVALFGAFGFLGAISYGHRSVPGKMVFIAAVVALVASVLGSLLTRRATATMIRSSTYMANTPRTLAIEESGLRLVGSSVDAFHPWSAFSGIEEHGGIVYLMLDRLYFYPIPDAAFESPEERDEFIAFVRGKIGTETTLSPTLSQGRGSESPALSQARGRISVWRTFLDALRLAFFRDVPEERMTRGWGTVLAAAFLTLLIPALPAVLRYGLAGEWNWYLVPSAVFHIPLIFAASIMAAYALGRRNDVARITLAGFLAAIAIDLIAMAFTALLGDVPNFSRLAMNFGWFPGVWLALALSTYACRSIEPGERRVGVVAACLVIIAIPLANVYRDRTLWHAPYIDDEKSARAEARMGAGGEDAFYKQPVLLAQELQAVEPGHKGVVDVFFIGMAGDSSQDVFMKEVSAVSRIFRERFGAEGHVIRLVNNSKSLLETPIASRTSLREALKRVGEVMDKDEDVLVLFLTSHGSEDHKFSLNLWPLRFHAMDPATLRTLLDESGIRNRVVVVSACYSGGFVKPLEDPGTLIITASAADRGSFGCTNEAEWTYFGKAYFNDALRKTHSFAEAFRIAKPAVTAREKSEKFDPSEPQMSMGPAIAAKLDELSAQLDRGGSPP